MSECWPRTPSPPEPFAPRIAVIPTDTRLYRVHHHAFLPAQFNPGVGSGGRFHFFGDPPVSVLYLAATREAALAETLLHDLPVDKPSVLRRSVYASSVLAGLSMRRGLEVAQFYGLGLRQLGIEATQLTDTPVSRYPATRPWAAAAHALGLDGVAWMSKRDNSARAYMLFGDRIGEDDLEAVPGSGLVFAGGTGRDWLVNTCAPLHIDVLPR